MPSAAGLCTQGRRAPQEPGGRSRPVRHASYWPRARPVRRARGRHRPPPAPRARRSAIGGAVSAQGFDRDGARALERGGRGALPFLGSERSRLAGAGRPCARPSSPRRRAAPASCAGSRSPILRAAKSPRRGHDRVRGASSMAAATASWIAPGIGSSDERPPIAPAVPRVLSLHAAILAQMPAACSAPVRGRAGLKGPARREERTQGRARGCIKGSFGHAFGGIVARRLMSALGLLGLFPQPSSARSTVPCRDPSGAVYWKRADGVAAQRGLGSTPGAPDCARERRKLLGVESSPNAQQPPALGHLSSTCRTPAPPPASRSPRAPRASALAAGQGCQRHIAGRDPPRGVALRTMVSGPGRATSAERFLRRRRRGDGGESSSRDAARDRVSRLPSCAPSARGRRPVAAGRRLVAERRPGILTDRLGHLVGFLDGVRRNRLEALFEVPRAAAGRIAQPRHHVEQLIEPGGAWSLARRWRSFRSSTAGPARRIVAVLSRVADPITTGPQDRRLHMNAGRKRGRSELMACGRRGAAASRIHSPRGVETEGHDFTAHRECFLGTEVRLVSRSWYNWKGFDSCRTVMRRSVEICCRVASWNAWRGGARSLLGHLLAAEGHQLQIENTPDPSTGQSQARMDRETRSVLHRCTLWPR